jgi:hypothetical protein
MDCHFKIEKNQLTILIDINYKRQKRMKASACSNLGNRITEFVSAAPCCVKMKYSFKNRFLPILLLLFVVSDVNGFFSTHGLRGIIKHVNKASNVMPQNPIQGPVTLNITEEEATKALLRKQSDAVQPMSLNLVQANVTTEKPAETTTPQPSPFDVPGFIPGQFLDEEGSAKLAEEPPVSDVFADFVEMIKRHMTDFWIVCILNGLIIVLTIFLLALCATALILTFTLQQEAGRPVREKKREKPAKPIEQEYPVQYDESVKED